MYRYRTSPVRLPLLVAALAFSLSGCLTTHVLPPEEDRNLPRLIAAAPLEAVCTFSPNDSEPSFATEGVRGHQFFMALFPFGTITTPPAQELAQYYIRREGGIAGVRCGAEMSPETKPLINVSVSDFALSGYDFFFFRKPTASVALLGELYLPDAHGRYLKRSCAVRGSDYELKQYAFARELSTVLDSAWSEAFSKLIRCLFDKRN